jgi:ApaG protein
MDIANTIQSYTATTDNVCITVHPLYVDGQSDILQRKFVFSYLVKIQNLGTERIQVLRRHWLISHAGNRIEEVEGEGVVGKQPVIEPGAFHTYSSFCILETFEGSMEGTYLIGKENGEYFRAVIPRFTLRAMAN